MKKLLLFLTLLPFTLFAAVEYDLMHGIDMSARTNISGTLLNQLVDLGTTATNKGMVIQSATTPDIANNPRYTNFLWLDTSNGTLKRYDAGTAAWVSASLGVGVVNTTNIANQAVTTMKLGYLAVEKTNIQDYAIDNTKIAVGTITTNQMGNNSVGTVELGDAVVTEPKLADNAVIERVITDGNVTSNKLSATAVNQSKIVDGAIIGNKIPANTITWPHLATNAFMYGLFTSNGVVVVSQGLQDATANIANGSMKIPFSAARAGTNYIVSVAPIVVGGLAQVDGWCVVSNNTANFTVKMWNAVGTNTLNPLMIMVFDPQ